MSDEEFGPGWRHRMAVRLMEVARRQAGQQRSTLSPSCAHRLKLLIERGVQRMSPSEGDMQEAVWSLSQIVDAMVASAADSDSGRVSMLTPEPHELGEGALDMALESICPLWPFC